VTIIEYIPFNGGALGTKVGVKVVGLAVEFIEVGEADGALVEHVREAVQRFAGPQLGGNGHITRVLVRTQSGNEQTKQINNSQQSYSLRFHSKATHCVFE
jgi:hypothetical protein